MSSLSVFRECRRWGDVRNQKSKKWAEYNCSQATKVVARKVTMKELNESQIDWNRNNCPRCEQGGRWLHLRAFNHNEKCDDVCLKMICNSCEFQYQGVVWESKGKWYEKD